MGKKCYHELIYSVEKDGRPVVRCTRCESIWLQGHEPNLKQPCRHNNIETYDGENGKVAFCAKCEAEWLPEYAGQDFEWSGV